jgi:hypothetical protein
MKPTNVLLSFLTLATAASLSNNNNNNNNNNNTPNAITRDFDTEHSSSTSNEPIDNLQKRKKWPKISFGGNEDKKPEDKDKDKPEDKDKPKDMPKPKPEDKDKDKPEDKDKPKDTPKPSDKSKPNSIGPNINGKVETGAKSDHKSDASALMNLDIRVIAARLAGAAVGVIFL